MIANLKLRIVILSRLRDLPSKKILVINTKDSSCRIAIINSVKTFHSLTKCNPLTPDSMLKKFLITKHFRQTFIANTAIIPIMREAKN